MEMEAADRSADGESKPADRSALGEGRYANYFEIGHNAFEFFLDFGQSGLESEPPRMYLRVYASPFVARALCEKLNESLARYQKSFGPIPAEDGE